MAKIAELVCYPIKGCAGISVPSAVVTPAGLHHDRSFMVIGVDGVFRSQRRDPGLALIRPDVSRSGSHLTLSAPGQEPLVLDIDRTGARRDVTLFGNPYRGVDQGDAVAAWLSDVLGAASRLVRVPDEHARVTGGQTPGTCGYADSGAVLVVSTSSLSLLNERITARDGDEPALPMERFRPNLVIDGWDEPHTEDRARRVKVGGVEFGYAKLALRCAVTTVDQVTGVKAGREPLRTLADYRRTAGGVAFGAKFAVLEVGELAVGDDFAVEEWAPSGVAP